MSTTGNTKDMTHMGNLMREYPIPEGSIIESIFEYQKSFACRFIPFDEILNESHTGNYGRLYSWVDELCICCLSELSETLNWLPWKHWKSYKDFSIDFGELRFELIDILHFVTNLCLVRDVEPKSWMIDLAPGLMDPVLNNDITPAIKSWIMAMQAALIGLYKAPLDKSQYEAVMYVLKEGFALLGMTTKDIWNYYRSKNQENFDRQARGY